MPYQKQEPQHTTEPSFDPLPDSGTPLSGVSVESGENHHNPAETGHNYEEWSDDPKHVKPIVDNTLYYNDLLRVKFKKKHDDGRKSKHVGKQMKYLLLIINYLRIYNYNSNYTNNQRSFLFQP